MSIIYIHIYDTPVVKIIYYIFNITSTEAKLFVIRCGLNQATQLTNIEHIVIVTDSIHVAKYLTFSFICTRFICHLSLRNLGSFSEETTTIPSHFGTAQVKINSFFTKQLTKRQKNSTYYLSFYVNFYRISVKRINAIKSSIYKK